MDQTVIYLLCLHCLVTNGLMVPTNGTYLSIGINNNTLRDEIKPNKQPEMMKIETVEKWSTEEYNPLLPPQIFDSDGNEVGFGTKILPNMQRWKGILVEAATEQTLTTEAPAQRKQKVIIKKVEVPYPVEKEISIPVEKLVSYPIEVPMPHTYPLEKKIIVPVKVSVGVPVSVPQPYPLVKYVRYPVEVPIGQPYPEESRQPQPQLYTFGKDMQSIQVVHNVAPIKKHKLYLPTSKPIHRKYEVKRREFLGPNMNRAYQQPPGLYPHKMPLQRWPIQRKRMGIVTENKWPPRRTKPDFYISSVHSHSPTPSFLHSIQQENSQNNNHLHTKIVIPQNAANVYNSLLHKHVEHSLKSDMTPSDFDLLKAQRMHYLKLEKYHPKVKMNDLIKSYWQVRYETSIPYPEEVNVPYQLKHTVHNPSHENINAQSVPYNFHTTALEYPQQNLLSTPNVDKNDVQSFVTNPYYLKHSIPQHQQPRLQWKLS